MMGLIKGDTRSLDYSPYSWARLIKARTYGHGNLYKSDRKKKM